MYHHKEYKDQTDTTLSIQETPQNIIDIIGNRHKYNSSAKLLSE